METEVRGEKKSEVGKRTEGVNLEGECCAVKANTSFLLFSACSL